MKVVEIREGFGFENLVVGERPQPTPRPGQVLLRMGAASLNYRDLLMVLGRYNPKQPLPLIPCSDGAGKIVDIGEGVERFEIGDRVCPIFAQRWIAGGLTPDRMRSTLGGPLDGTLTELMAVDAEGLVRVPAHLTDEEAATLPCAAVTAWNALVTHGGLQAGQTVLVQGTGGVSIFALQLAQTFGARVIVTSSSDEKLERARSLGAWETINYLSTPEWGRRARDLAGGGVDLVIDVGGAGTLQQSLAAVRPEGRVCVIGILSGFSTELNVLPLLMQQVRMQGVFVGHRESFEAMNRAITEHGLRPAIHQVHRLDDARHALEQLRAARHIGKICLRIG